jgi:1,2-diacylglycerol 3-alpha-glucosyltransferase
MADPAAARPDHGGPPNARRAAGERFPTGIPRRWPRAYGLPDRAVRSIPGAPVRVVHFSDTYLPRRDGVVTSILTLAAALVPHGHSSTLFAPRYPGSAGGPALALEPLASLPSGVAGIRLAAWPRSRHVAAVAAARPDVVHVHTPGPAGLLGILAAGRLGLPLVQTYHTDLQSYADAYRIPTRALRVGIAAYRRRLGLAKTGGRPQQRTELLDRGSAMLLAQTDALVVPTRAVLRRVRLPIDPYLISVVPTGVAHRPVPAGAAAAFRSRWGLPDADPVVLFVGRVNREKGIDLLLDAFARLRAAVPRAQLVLAGAIYDPAWLRRLLTGHGLDSGVVRTGELPAADVAAAYAAADVFAFPSLTDTQGLVLQEAALAGLPVVVVDAELNDLGALAGSAHCVPPEPAALAAGLQRLLGDPGFARAVAGRARLAAQEHTPDRYAAAIAGVYAAAAARRTGWTGTLAA